MSPTQWYLSPDYSVCPSYAPFPCLPHLTFYPGSTHPLTCSIFALSLPHETKFRGQGLGLFQFQWTQAWHDQYCTCLLKEWTNVQGEETKVLHPLTNLAGYKLVQCLSWFRKEVSHLRDVEHLSLIRIQVAGPKGKPAGTCPRMQ